MWWAGAEPVDLFIGQARVGVAVDGQPPQWTQASSAEEGWRRARESLGVARRRWRRPARIWLSGSLARPFLLRPVAGVKSRDEATRIAQRVAQEQTGLVGECEVWLDVWRSEQTCLATAVDTSVCSALSGKEARGAFSVRSIRPWWSVVLNALVSSQSGVGLVGVDDGESLTMLGGLGGSFTVAGSYGALDHAQGVSTISRTLMSHDGLGAGGIWATSSASSLEGGHADGNLDVPMGAVWRHV